MSKPRAATTIRKTPNFDFLFGSYSQSSIRIPYFQSIMTFADAKEYLRLVSEMPGAASMDWQIEELFQRDIDWARVERKIVPYLKQEQEPHFFNALTIALLPIHDDAIAEFGSAPWSPPSLENESGFEKIKDYGPIRVGYWQDWINLEDPGARIGQLSWNTKQVAGIAIDGQHRLAAIKRVAQGGGSAFSNCHVPVILVVLDESLGYTGGISREATVSTLRRLFIDLNKHAKIPSRARQILLDDRDPAAMCVRALVGSSLSSGINELSETPPRLPLSLIDWHSEQAKFDGGPYLSTVLGLDWGIAQLLNVKSFADVMAFDQISKSIDTLEARLEIDLSDARNRLNESRRYERPFSFSDEELTLISLGFAREWNPSLIKLLTKFSPYAELINERQERGTLRPEFSNWFALKERADEAKGAAEASRLLGEFEQHLANRDHTPIAISDFITALEQFETVKQRNEIAYLVVFQRAYILAFKQFIKVTDAMTSELQDAEGYDITELNELGDDADQDDEPIQELKERERRADELVRALNDLISKEPAFLRKDFDTPYQNEDEGERFWLGTIALPDGSIDFTQSASKRASDWLLLAAYFLVFIESNPDLTFDELFDRAQGATRGIDLKLQQCFGRLFKGAGSTAGRILSYRDEAHTERALQREVLSRARWMWNTLSS